MKNFVIIDGNNHLFIGYNAALRDRPNSDEDLSNKLYHIISIMIQVLKRKFSGEFYVCWDTAGGTSSRKKLDPSYKSNRDHSKINFKIMESCKSIYEDYGIKSIGIPHCEADDAIFALSRVLKEKNPQSKITIVSRDHDLIQVVQKGYATEIYDPVKKSVLEIPWYDIVKFKALIGDSSDCISGVRGIGEKSALKILSGKVALKEDQKKEYEKCLLLVDAEKNPQYESNYESLKLIFT